jgi:hypothetical protein
MAGGVQNDHVKNGTGRACSKHGEKSNIYIYIYRALVGKPERKRPLGRPRRTWEKKRTNLGEIAWGGIDWIHLA